MDEKFLLIQLNELVEGQKKLGKEIASIKQDIDSIKTQVQESTKILMSKDPKAEMNKAGHDKMITI